MVAYGRIGKDSNGTRFVESGGQYWQNKLDCIEIDDADEGELTLKFMIAEIGNENKPAISYEWEHDSIYTIHVWSEGNTGTPTSEQQLLRDLRRCGNNSLNQRTEHWIFRA